MQIYPITGMVSLRDSFKILKLNIIKVKKFNIKTITAIVAVVVVGAGSAFTLNTNTHMANKRTGFFYKYEGSLTAVEIAKAENYVRSEEPCTPGENLCGVYLASDPTGTDHPLQGEVDSIADDAWTSQQNGESELPETILMRD